MLKPVFITFALGRLAYLFLTSRKEGTSLKRQITLSLRQYDQISMIKLIFKGSLALGFPPIVRERYEQMVGPDDYSLKIENVQLSDEDDFECQITPHGMRSQVSILDK